MIEFSFLGELSPLMFLIKINQSQMDLERDFHFWVNYHFNLCEQKRNLFQ